MSGRFRGGFAALAKGLACVGLLVAMTGGAMAQGVPGFRPGQDLPSPQQQPIQPQTSAPEINVPQGTGQVIPEQAKTITFTLSGVRVTGSTVYNDDQLRPLYQDKIGKKVSLADIYEVANALTAKYRADGYVLSRAMVPAQRVSDGTIQITAVEGYVDSGDIQGSDSAKARLTPYLHQVMVSRPLSITALERALLLMNDVPGMTARALLRPSAANVGASHLTVMATWQPFTASDQVDNYNDKFTGPFENTLVASLQSITPYGDKESIEQIDSIPTNDLRATRATGSIPLGTDGLTLNAQYASSFATPQSTLAKLLTESYSTAQAYWLSYPIIRSRSQNLSVEAGVWHKLVDTDALGARLTTDRVTYSYARGVYDWSDRWSGSNIASATMEFGGAPGVWGRSSNLSQSSSNPLATDSFQKLTAEMIRLQKLPWAGFGMTFGLTGQYAWSSLPTPEDFLLGGIQYGRGYAPGELSGDDGVAGKMELTYDNTLPFVASDQFRYQLYAFYDAGVTWTVHTNAANAAQSRESLASTGVGVRLHLSQYASLEGLVAKPLTRRPADVNETSGGQAHRPLYLVGLKLSY